MCANPVVRNNSLKIMNKQLTMIDFAQTYQVQMNCQKFFSQVVEVLLERIGCFDSIDRNSYLFHRVRPESLHRLLRFSCPILIWAT